MASTECLFSIAFSAFFLCLFLLLLAFWNKLHAVECLLVGAGACGVFFIGRENGSDDSPGMSGSDPEVFCIK